MKTRMYTLSIFSHNAKRKIFLKSSALEFAIQHGMIPHTIRLTTKFLNRPNHACLKSQSEQKLEYLPCIAITTQNSRRKIFLKSNALEFTIHVQYGMIPHIICPASISPKKRNETIPVLLSLHDRDPSTHILSRYVTGQFTVLNKLYVLKN